MSITFLSSKPFPDVPVQFTLSRSLFAFTGVIDNADGITKIWWAIAFKDSHQEYQTALAVVYRFRENIARQLPCHHGLSKLGVLQIETLFGTFSDFLQSTGPITCTHPRK